MSFLICLMAASWSLVSVNSKASSNSRCQLLSGEYAKPFGHAALRVELQQLVGHVAHLGFDARFGAFPGHAAQAVQPRRRAFTRAAIFLDQIQARQRNVELGVARVFEQHEVALVVALRDLARAQESADAVRFMHHVIAGLQIRHVGGEGGQLRFAWGRAWRPDPTNRKDLRSRRRRSALREKRRRAAPVL